MSLKVFRGYFFVLLCIISAQSAPEKTVEFEIGDNNTCNHPGPVDVCSGETLRITVTGKNIYSAKCVANGGNQILNEDDYDNKYKHMRTAWIENVSQVHNGRWDCTFSIKEDNVRYVSCYVDVNVTVSTPNSDWINYYIIGGIVGAVVVVIIFIVQTIIICRYKSRERLKHLERPATTTCRKDENRYSQMPVRKRSAASNTSRERSAIYQTIEDVKSAVNDLPPNIKDRPPMPLPHDSEDSDVDRSYEGQSGRATYGPSPMPKRKKVSQSAPKPAPKPKPVEFQDMEDYDYADSIELEPMNCSLLKNAMPVHGRQNDTTPYHKTLSRPLRPQRAFTPPEPKQFLPTPEQKRHLPPPEPDIPFRLERPFIPPKGRLGLQGQQGPFGSPGSPGAFEPSGLQGPLFGVPNTPVLCELNNILKKRNQSEAGAVESAPLDAIFTSLPRKPKRNVPSPSPSPPHFESRSLRFPQQRNTRSPTNAWQTKPPDQKPKVWFPGPQSPRLPSPSERPPRRYGGPQGVSSQEPRLNEDMRRQEMSQDRVVCTPQSNRRLPGRRSHVTSPPLPRKPNQGAYFNFYNTKNRPVNKKCGGSKPFPKRPAPAPPADTDSEYEQIGPGEDDSDDDWQMEEIAPYHIYNV